MHNLLHSGLFVDETKIKILPFFNDESFVNIDNVKNSKEICFAYIADGQPQKNHLYLFEAWKILFESYNIKFKLILTVSDSYPELLFQIEKLRNFGLNIENLGLVQHSVVLKLYSSINYLVYPSLIESFGLPLIEASSLGCDVIAIDKGYVTDVIKPSRSFSEYRVTDLVEIIIDIHKGIMLPKTTISIKNKMKEFIELIA
jgi:glycosyltransferase involved in cell wall biosynthesis